MIAKLRERRSVANRVDQIVDIDRFDVRKLKNEEIKVLYQVQISYRSYAFRTLNEDADEVDIMIHGKISDNIKVAAGKSIGYYQVKKKKPWFYDNCSNIVERRKQPKLRFLQDLT